MNTDYLKGFFDMMLLSQAAVMPKRIIKSGPVTVVFFDDDEKIVVRRSPDEPDDDYAAFTAALAKKIYGNNSKIRKAIKLTTVDKTPKKPHTDEKTEEPKNDMGELKKLISEAKNVQKKTVSKHDILKLYMTGKYNQTQIAKKVGCSVPTVSKTVKAYSRGEIRYE